MTTSTTITSNPVDLFLADLEAGAGMGTSYWTADAQLDATVPQWRFEQRGADAVAATFSGWYNVPISIDRITRTPVPGGETVELDLSWVEDGMPFAAHQVHLIELDGDRIARDTAFCGGRWPAALLAEMGAAGGR
jgi:hypothetical protein